jgi:hypothetical protein
MTLGIHQNDRTALGLSPSTRSASPNGKPAPNGTKLHSVRLSVREISSIDAGANGRTESAAIFSKVFASGRGAADHRGFKNWFATTFFLCYQAEVWSRGIRPFFSSKVYQNVNSSNNRLTVCPLSQRQSYRSPGCGFSSVDGVCYAVTHSRARLFYPTKTIALLVNNPQFKGTTAM